MCTSFILAAADVCEPEFHSNVLWDVRNNISAHEIQSEPICLNDIKMNMIRRCDEGDWIPKKAPNCRYRQKAYEHSELCPLNYKTIIRNNVRLCVLITAPTSWKNECIYDGSSTMFYQLNDRSQNELVQYLKELNVTEIWMPAKRFARYGPVIWTVGGELFGEQVEFYKINVHLIDETTHNGEGCFSADVQTNLSTGSIRNCSDQLNILCAFRFDLHDTSLMTLACPKHSYTVPYRTSDPQCYSIHSVDRRFFHNRTIQQKYWIHSECDGDLFTINSVERIKIFMQLASLNDLRNSDRCLFAVAPDNQYITSGDEWRMLIKNINYVNWDYPILNGSIVATNKHGKWNWIDHGFDCLACSKPIELRRPELALSFDKKKRRLYMTIYNEEYLWRTAGTGTGVKCFTNADDELIKTVDIGRKKWSGTLSLDQINQKDHNESRLRKKSKAIYELKMYGEGPGYYWCEGYTMSQFDLIVSPKVVAFRRERGEVFATLVKTHCKVCEKFVMKNYTKSYAKQFREHLKEVYKLLRKSNEHGNPFSGSEISIENVRIMQIEHITTAPQKNANRTVTILYHITVSLHRCDDEIEHCRLFQIGAILERLLQNMTLVQTNRPYEFISMNSTEYCLPEQFHTAKDLNGTVAKIGETIPQNKLCLLPSGLPALQTCVGDFMYGGVWKYTKNRDCYLKPDQMTKELFKFAKEMATSDQVSDRAMQNISILLHKNAQKMVAADVFYLGRIMSDFSRLNNKNSINTFNLSDTQHVFSIYNDLMYLNENTTRKSAALNSTNILLDAFDNILNGIQIDITSVANDRNHTIEVNSGDGTITTQTPNLIVYVIDPSIKNVSGVALIKKKAQLSNDESNDDFTDYYIRTLYANQSSDELLNEDNLEIATFVPTSLLDLLNSSNDDMMDETTVIPIRIVISIYYNDRLFQEVKSKRRIKSAGKVISVSIPGYGPNLPALLPTFSKSRIVANASHSMCGYWNFENHYATWSDDGCEFIGKSHHSVDPIVLCACSHLTHYSYLIVGTHFQSLYAGEDDVIITKSHEKALDMITLLGCLLSLLGVCGITITAIIFRTWRQKPSSIVLLQLSAAIALQMILLCFVNTEYSSMYLIIEQQFLVCVALGALLQYSILVAFSWMLITAHLQFMRYVIVLGPQRSNRFFLKSFLLGWVSPLIPVVIVVIIAPNSYVQSVGTSNSGGICYPSGTSLYFGLILPIGVIILANLVIFILVIYHILVGPSANIRSNKRTLAIAQLRLSVFLFFLLGLSWIFGFLASVKSGIVFSYLFCLTATIQGFVLFIYFIILDSSTRKLWRNLFTRSFK